jgi:hypothetical protein
VQKLAQVDSVLELNEPELVLSLYSDLMQLAQDFHYAVCQYGRLIVRFVSALLVPMCLECVLVLCTLGA